MKRNFMKKAVAVSLSAAMALSLSSVSALTASAATSTVAMAKTASVKVGKSKTLKLTKNTKKWKIKAVSSTNKKFCTVKKVNTSKVKITGKKATTSKNKVTIRVRVKSSVKKAEKVLKCKVTVKGTTTPTPDQPVDPTPDNPNPPAVETKKTVANQAELDAALADTNIKEITISTTDKVDFTIKEGTHSDVDLIVNAQLASVTNSATFKSITIENISPDTWTEDGTGNTITSIASNFHLKLTENATVKQLTIKKKGTLKITGQGKAAVPVRVEADAADSVVTSEAPIAVVTLGKITITLEKTAKGSTITMQRGAVKFSVALTNKTDEDIPVKTDDGKTVATAPKNSTAPTTAEAPVTDTTTPVDPNKPGTTTPGQTRVSLPNNAYMDIDGITTSAPSASVTVESTSGSAVTNPTPSAVKYTVGVKVSASGGKALLQTVKPDSTKNPVVEAEYKDLGVDVAYFAEVRKGTVGGTLMDGDYFDSSKEFTLETNDSGTIYYINVFAYTKANNTYEQSRNVRVKSYKVTVGTAPDGDKVKVSATVVDGDTFADSDDYDKEGTKISFAKKQSH